MVDVTNSFLIVESFNIKKIDIFYKTLKVYLTYNNIGKPCFKVRFLVMHPNNEYLDRLKNIQAVVGLTDQIFNTNTIVRKVNKFSFSNTSEERISSYEVKNLKTLNFFWFYCPDSIQSSLISFGLIGTHFPYFRFGVMDIFNFFGAEFYQSFYQDYFGFSNIFVVDFFLNAGTTISKKYISVDEKINFVYSKYAIIKNFISFYKIFGNLFISLLLC